MDRPQPPSLTAVERASLALPLVGSAALGLPLYVFARPFARVVDLRGDDAFIYNLAGAAMLGYAVALAFGVRTGLWRRIRFVVLATYAFVVLAFFAGLVGFISGATTGFVLLTTLWAVIVGWLLAQILVARGRTPSEGRDVATWVVVVLVLATASAAVFGLAPQVPGPFAALMGYRGTDEYVYRLAGAACFGYAVMGVAELRALRWDDMRLANVAALIFNGLAFVAAGFEILLGRTTPLAIIVALAAGFFTAAIAVILVRRGR